MRHLTDLDELLEQVRSTYSREYLSEAITTYRAGAYRAAVAITWVAVCIDIMEKIRELSAEGDRAAKELEETLNKLSSDDTKAMQAFEGSLLIDAKEKLNIISAVEQKQLQRIKEDRNLCVHPTFQQEGQHVAISAEVARAHIVTACTYLLIMAPIKGKELIEKILTRIKETSFPSDTEKVFSILSSDHYLGRTQDSVFRNLCIVILKSIFLPDMAPPPPHYVERYAATLNVIERLRPKIFQDTLKEKLNKMVLDCKETNLNHMFLLLKKSPKIWTFLHQASQTRILELITRFSVEDVIVSALLDLENIRQISVGIQDLINKQSPQELLKIAKHKPHPIFKRIVIDKFREAGSFDSAASFGNKFILPHAQYFNDVDLKDIFNSLLQNNHISDAWGMDDILTTLYSNTKCIPEHNQIWADFWLQLDIDSNFGFKYSSRFSLLNKNLITDGIIDTPE